MYVGAECRECKAACETLIFGGCIQKICRLKMWSDYSLEVVDAVARNGSFTGAAARLEMSAVMVGKYIALIERQLNTRLLERNTRRQSLTDAGRVYFDEAKRVLEQVSIAESAVERLRIAPAGTLRVSAPTSFGACVIAPLTRRARGAGSD